MENKPNVKIEYRSLVFVLLMSFLTLGIYYIYWLYQTKEEINKLGGDIPTFFFAILPIVHFYFSYEYANNYVTHVAKQPDNTVFTIFLTLIMSFTPFGIIVVQQGLNKLAKCNSCKES